MKVLVAENIGESGIELLRDAGLDVEVGAAEDPGQEPAHDSEAKSQEKADVIDQLDHIHSHLLRLPPNRER